MKLRRSIILTFATILVIMLVATELLLRLQQAIGPLYDLKMAEAGLATTSEVLNHKPAFGATEFTLEPKHVYGAFSGFRYTVNHDSNGIQLSALRPNDGGSGLRVLFMGDSFMEGFDDKNSIPQHVYEYFKAAKVSPYQPVFWNAGCSSYSPAIYIPLAKALLPRLHPDYIVLDIDETDLGDDWFRYKHLIRRDDAGRIVGVSSTPINVQFQQGLRHIRESPFYIVRLVKKVKFTYVTMAAAIRRYDIETKDRHPLSVLWETQAVAEQKYKPAIEFFEHNVDELCRTLIDLMNGPERILICRHPHLLQLQKDPGRGRVWNAVGAEVVGRVAARNHIRFYNAEADLRTRFGGTPAAYYWVEDMHFNFTGLKIYSDDIARQLEIVVRANEGRSTKAPVPLAGPETHR